MNIDELSSIISDEIAKNGCIPKKRLWQILIDKNITNLEYYLFDKEINRLIDDGLLQFRVKRGNKGGICDKKNKYIVTINNIQIEVNNKYFLKYIENNLVSPGVYVLPEISAFEFVRKILENV